MSVFSHKYTAFAILPADEKPYFLDAVQKIFSLIRPKPCLDNDKSVTTCE
jgi:hypothetical protein